MKTDRELLRIMATMRPDKSLGANLDLIGDLSKVDLDRMEQIDADRIRLGKKVQDSCAKILECLKSLPQCGTLTDALEHYQETGQREEYQRLFDVMSELVDTREEIAKWDDLAR